jgi:hypothetical protein
MWWIKRGDRTVNLDVVRDIERYHRQKSVNYKEAFFIRFNYTGQSSSVEFNFSTLEELDNYYMNLQYQIEAKEISTKKDPLL